MLRFIAPLVIFAIMVGFFVVGLQKDPQKLPSALIDKPVPQFQLAQLHNPARVFTQEDMKGKVWMLNVFASWCASCRAEHPLFMELNRTGQANMLGLNYKDKPADANQWLARLGDPYAVIVSDIEGSLGLDLGVYGVPETFIVDKQGVIRYKHVGPVSRKDWEETIAPMIKELEG
jgi:cytochrome c biogenesis protein CcmG/thiol:disulfide interchange protein DsbE